MRLLSIFVLAAIALLATAGVRADADAATAAPAALATPAPAPAPAASSSVDFSEVLSAIKTLGEEVKQRATGASSSVDFAPVLDAVKALQTDIKASGSEKTAEAIESLKASIEKVASGASATGSSALEASIEKISQKVESLSGSNPALESTVASIVASLKDVKAQIADIITSVKEHTKASAQSFSERLDKLEEKIGGLLKTKSSSDDSSKITQVLEKLHLIEKKQGESLQAQLGDAARCTRDWVLTKADEAKTLVVNNVKEVDVKQLRAAATEQANTLSRTVMQLANENQAKLQKLAIDNKLPENVAKPAAWTAVVLGGLVAALVGKKVVSISISLVLDILTLLLCCRRRRRAPKASKRVVAEKQEAVAAQVEREAADEKKGEVPTPKKRNNKQK